MSNKKAFVSGIAAVFGIYIALGVVTEIVENRVIRYLQNDGIISVDIIKFKNKNEHKDAKDAKNVAKKAEKEES